MTSTALFSLFSLQLMVLVTLLLLPLMADTALSAHAVCTWVPGPGSPLQYEYRHYCYARLIIRGPSSADYQCIPNAATPTAIVADWGKRGNELLEWREYANLALWESLLTLSVPSRMLQTAPVALTVATARRLMGVAEALIGPSALATRPRVNAVTWPRKTTVRSRGRSRNTLVLNAY